MIEALTTNQEVDIEVAILVLAIVGVATVLVTAAILITMMYRQRRDLADSRKIVAAQIDLAVLLEYEERRTRHAIKNLCATLTNLLRYWEELPVKVNFDSIVAQLEEPPEMADARLIHGLVSAREAAAKDDGGLAE